jgi:hypothetical protein
MGLLSVSRGWNLVRIGILPGNDRKKSASVLESNHFEPVLIEELEDEDYTTEIVADCSSSNELDLGLLQSPEKSTKVQELDEKTFHD